jgi:hypothetical protein
MITEKEIYEKYPKIFVNKDKPMTETKKSLHTKVNTIQWG